MFALPGKNAWLARRSVYIVSFSAPIVDEPMSENTPLKSKFISTGEMFLMSRADQSYFLRLG